MDSSNSNSAGSRPDLTIPIPAGFVSTGPQSPPAQLQQQQQQQQPQQQQQVKLNMAATIAAAAAAAAAAAGGGGVSTANAVTPAATAAENGATAAAASGKKVRYRECLKNHAAGIGGHAVDGCGEFMPSKEGAPVPAACDDAPAPLRCAACGCHRNFHRREVEGEKPPPCEQCRKRQLTSPQTPQQTQGTPQQSDAGTHSGGPLKKRFRTKFSGEQKERMYMLSEKLGWRIQKHDEAEVAQFCADTGVKRHVLKVWMHNNKHTFANKKGLLLPAASSPSSSSQHHHQQQQQPQQHQQQQQQQQQHEPT